MKILMKEGMLLGLLLTTLALPAMAEGQCLGNLYYCNFYNDGRSDCTLLEESVTCSECEDALQTGNLSNDSGIIGIWCICWKPTTNCPDAELECPDKYYTVCPECCDGKDNDGDGRIDCDDPECACCCDQTENTDDTAECVPEPITLAMTTLGILGVLGFISLKRERR